MVRRAKTAPENALRDPTRRKLLALILGAPGTRFATLCRTVGLNRGTLRYHLLVLERIGAIRTFRSEHLARYFPPNAESSDIRVTSFLLRGRVLEVVQAMVNQPGISQRELTKGLGLSRKVFRDYADELVQQGLVDEVWESRLRKYYATPRLAGAIDGVRATNNLSGTSGNPPGG